MNTIRENPILNQGDDSPERTPRTPNIANTVARIKNAPVLTTALSKVVLDLNEKSPAAATQIIGGQIMECKAFRQQYAQNKLDFVQSRA